MRPACVVLIGPESTGKTWLARELAAHYGVPWVAEHVRDYVADRGRELTEADVDASIAAMLRPETLQRLRELSTKISDSQR